MIRLNLFNIRSEILVDNANIIAKYHNHKGLPLINDGFQDSKNRAHGDKRACNLHAEVYAYTNLRGRKSVKTP